MKRNLAERIRASRPDSIYQTAAERFNTSYDYVIQIATGWRKAKRGKAREIREWMEKQVKNR